LPDPEAPISATISPGATASDTTVERAPRAEALAQAVDP